LIQDTHRVLIKLLSLLHEEDIACSSPEMGNDVTKDCQRNDQAFAFVLRIVLENTFHLDR
jgi:hypothetical protein